MYTLINTLTFISLRKKIIQENQECDFRFGLEVILTHFITFGTIIAISAFTESILNTALFCTVFCFMRNFSFGYHCKTFLGCYILTIASCFTSVYIASNMFYSKFFLVFKILNIFLFATCRYKYKSLQRKEKKYVFFTSLFMLYSFFGCYMNIITLAVFIGLLANNRIFFKKSNFTVDCI